MQGTTTSTAIACRCTDDPARASAIGLLWIVLAFKYKDKSAFYGQTCRYVLTIKMHAKHVFYIKVLALFFCLWPTPKGGTWIIRKIISMQWSDPFTGSTAQINSRIEYKDKTRQPITLVYLYEDLTCREGYQQPGGQDMCRDQHCLHSLVCSLSEEKIEKGGKKRQVEIEEK